MMNAPAKKNKSVLPFLLQARQQFEAQLDQMSHVKSRLADRSVSSELVK